MTGLRRNRVAARIASHRLAGCEHSDETCARCLADALLTNHLVVIDPQDPVEVERLRELLGIEIYTDHLSNALAAFARGERSGEAMA